MNHGEDGWIASKVDSDSFDPTMASLFSPSHTGLLLFRMNKDFEATHGNHQVLSTEFQTLRGKEASWEASQKEILEHQAKTERSIQLLEEAFECSRQVQLKLEAEAQRSKQAEEKLRADLETERKRAQLAEKNLAEASAAVAENVADVNDFIANGSREDTEAFYRIKVRHLITLAQARLAYIVHWTTSLDDRNGSLIWRNRFVTSAELDSLEKKMAKAAKLLAGLRNSTGEDQTALDAIVQSQALKVLVDDSTLRYAGDTAAHPGPLTKDNVEGYRSAIQATDGTSVRALESCIAFLLFYAT